MANFEGSSKQRPSVQGMFGIGDSAELGLSGIAVAGFTDKDVQPRNADETHAGTSRLAVPKPSLGPRRRRCRVACSRCNRGAIAAAIAAVGTSNRDPGSASSLRSRGGRAAVLCRRSYRRLTVPS